MDGLRRGRSGGPPPLGSRRQDSWEKRLSGRDPGAPSPAGPGAAGRAAGAWQGRGAAGPAARARGPAQGSCEGRRPAGDAQGLLTPPPPRTPPAAAARRSLTLYPPRARHRRLPRPPPAGTGRRPARGRQRRRCPAGRHVAPCPAAAPGGGGGGPSLPAVCAQSCPGAVCPEEGLLKGAPPRPGGTPRRAPAAARHPRARGPRPRPRPPPPSVGGRAFSPRRGRVAHICSTLCVIYTRQGIGHSLVPAGTAIYLNVTERKSAIVRGFC